MAVGTTTTRVLLTPQFDCERFHANFGPAAPGIPKYRAIVENQRAQHTFYRRDSQDLATALPEGKLKCPNVAHGSFWMGNVDLLAFQVRAPQT
jgi:hypothetical protein